MYYFIRFLAAFDVLAGILLVLGPELVPLRLLLGHGLYLLLKGKLFKGDFLSAIDFSIGIYCIIALLFPISLLSWMAGGYLLLKGGLSFI